MQILAAVRSTVVAAAVVSEYDTNLSTQYIHPKKSTESYSLPRPDFPSSKIPSVHPINSLSAPHDTSSRFFLGNLYTVDFIHNAKMDLKAVPQQCNNMVVVKGLKI